MLIAHLRRPAGGVLLMVTVVIFLILVLMVALFQTQSVSRTAQLRGEGELVLRQAQKFEEASRVRNLDLTAPGWLGPRPTVEQDASRLADATFGAALYDGLANLKAPQALSFDADTQGYPGSRYLRVGPSEFAFGVLPTHTGHRRVASTQDAPFAVVSGAAEQSGYPAVRLGRLVAWQNPTWGDESSPQAAWSGVAPVVAARGDVAVQGFPYGYAVLGSGRLTVAAQASGDPGPVALRADDALTRMPVMSLDDYRRTLRDGLSRAVTDLTDAAQPADRTGLLMDGISPGEALGLFFTQHAVPAKLRNHLSLNQSQNFWLPVIPGFTRQFFVLYHFIFHVPAPPDGGLDSVSRAARSILQDVINLIMQIEKARDAVQSAEDAVERARAKVNCDCSWYDVPCWAACAAEEAALYIAQGILEVAKAAVTLLENALFALVSPVTDLLEGTLAAVSQLDPPATRAAEGRFYQDTGVNLDKGGMDFWAYRAIFSKIGNIASDLFSGNLDKVGSDFGQTLTVVFFGQPDKRQSWSFDNGRLVARATLNVPRGRTFYFSGAMTVQGDLWLARGATMVVNGNLTLQAGDTPTTGRLYLEEGATLVVHGDFTAAGDDDRGSVVVASRMGEVHGLTAAVLCEGAVNLPHGVLPGVALDELPVMQGGKPTGSLIPVTTMVRTLLDTGAWNLAKIDGPFHHRLPYMARFATTFEFISGLDIPFVCPMNFPNLTVFAYRGLTLLYSTSLNFSLGENFVTHTDWWGTGGEGRVPILVKPEAVLAAGALAGATMTYDASLTGSGLSDKLRTRSGQVGGAAVDRFTNGLCLALAAEWSKAIIAGTGIPLVSYGAIVSNVLTAIEKSYYNLDQRTTELDNLVPDSTWAGLKSDMTELWALSSAATAAWTPRLQDLLQECSGALVYGGTSVQVGGTLASGWFVGGGDVAMTSTVTVGSLVSLDGRVSARDLYFYPPFTRASLVLPQPETADWVARAQVTGYGGAIPDSRPAAQRTRALGTMVERVVAEWWEARR